MVAVATRYLRSLVLALAAVFCVMAFGLYLRNGEVPTRESGLACDRPSYDAGDVYVGVPVHHTFEIRNVGTRVVSILDVKSGCPCTTVGPIADLTLQPGSIARVPLTFVPTPPLGDQHQVVLVRTSDPDQPKLWLHIRGRLVSKPDEL